MAVRPALRGYGLRSSRMREPASRCPCAFLPRVATSSPEWACSARVEWRASGPHESSALDRQPGVALQGARKTDQCAPGTGLMSSSPLLHSSRQRLVRLAGSGAAASWSRCLSRSVDSQSTMRSLSLRSSALAARSSTPRACWVQRVKHRPETSKMPGALAGHGVRRLNHELRNQHAETPPRLGPPAHRFRFALSPAALCSARGSASGGSAIRWICLS